MYYTITNSIGTEVEVNDTDLLVCGQCYPTKMKAPKDGNYILAFSKAENPVDGLVWRFDGKADIDAEMFVEEIDPEERDILAWKAEKINIQARIRPSKDSKKAIAQATRVDEVAKLNAQYADGTIDAAEFGRLAILLAGKMV